MNPFPVIRVPEWFQAFNPACHDAERAKEGYRRKLPHWRYEGATYFVTYRLGDSLPAEVAEKLRHEEAEWKKRVETERAAMGGLLSATTRLAWDEFQKQHFMVLDAVLDACHGCCVLRGVECCSLVETALRYFEGVRCRMAAFVVMPNHVHALCQPLPGWALEDLAGSWKKHTAGKINKLTRKEGRVWQPETYDRIIRDGEHFRDALRYIVRNPVKAKLRADEATVWGREGILEEEE